MLISVTFKGILFVCYVLLCFSFRRKDHTLIRSRSSKLTGSQGSGNPGLTGATEKTHTCENIMNCPPSDPSGLSNILKVVSTLFPATDHMMMVMFQVPTLSLPAVTSGGEISFMVASFCRPSDNTQRNYMGNFQTNLTYLYFGNFNKFNF